MAGRILIVDDDGPQRRSLRMGLEMAGFEAREAGNAEEAMGRLEHEAVDLAIVDVMLPGVTGLQLVRRLQFRHPQLPVVLTSGYHMGRHHLERAGLNAVAFVPKPYNLDELSAFLRRKMPQAS
ncbi:MAG: response regulator [Myxococcales bacterium]|jgi:DNA-binding NtrC family response regulator